ncbi:MAG TPA: sulfotransferase [Solirubrobacterales bacterium]|jgi:hypothetical protein|nr:sulfotransferase [Solirubrobacterales bacterium]
MTALEGPDFFIVGAPKCGTTAMADYLGQHPEIGMCPRKETHVFATDLSERMAMRRGQRPMSRERFLDLFADLQEERLRGEASVWHLYSATAAAEIAAFQPQARIIVMLRSPVEMLPSLHSQFVFVGIEPEEDFGSALALDAERERSGPPAGFPPRSYRSAVRYGEQLRRYLDVFGRERIHVIVYDEFRDDTRGAYREACRFLEVDSSFEPNLEVVNPNKRVRSRTFRRFVRRPPEWVRPAIHRVTSEPMRRRAARAMIRWNTSVGGRAPLAQPVRAELESEAAREARELDELLGLDVSDWVG